jgi:type I restriction-modification system DNA methylase subunit
MKKTTSVSAIIYIDDEHAQVTKAFEKKACIFGTDEFKLWREYKKEFPKAKMVTKSIKKNPDQKNRRNMTFANMKAYIATQPNAKELEEEFKTIKQRSKIQKSPYQYVLSWFEATFDGYNDLDQFMAEKEAERKAKEAEKAAEKAAAEADETDEEEND